jgi:hypothetical protein
LTSDTHALHEVSHSVTADRDPISGQVVHHPAAAAAGIFQVENIDSGHDPQCRFPHRYRPEVQRGSSQTQQYALAAADADIEVVVIDQLAQFTGIRAAETFF